MNQLVYETVHGTESTYFDFTHILRTSQSIPQDSLFVICDKKGKDKDIPVLYPSHSKWIDFQKGIVSYPSTTRKNSEYLNNELLIEGVERNTPTPNIKWNVTRLRIIYAQFST